MWQYNILKKVGDVEVASGKLMTYKIFIILFLQLSDHKYNFYLNFNLNRNGTFKDHNYVQINLRPNLDRVGTLKSNCNLLAPHIVNALLPFLLRASVSLMYCYQLNNLTMFLLI